MPSYFVFGQLAVNYTVELVQFEAHDTGCTSDGFGFDEEVTWHCWASDNDQVTNFTNDSGNDCYGKDGNVHLVMAVPEMSPDLLSQTNSLATTVYVRLEAWEDDNFSNSVGSPDRCSYDSGDDCYSDNIGTINFRNDPMCQWNQYTVNSGDFDVVVRVKWEYSTFNGGIDFTECGTSVTLAGAGSGEWSVFSGSNGGFINTLDPETSFSGDPNTSYTVLWSNLPDCITPNVTDTVYVDFVNNPIPNMLSDATTYCENNPVNFTAQDGVLYTWSVNNTTNQVQSNGSGTYVYTPAMNDTVVYVDVDNGSCTTLDSINFTVLSSPAPTVSFTGGVLSTQSFPFYQWYLNGSPIPGATTQDYTPTQNGSYHVEVASANSCIGESSPFAINNVGIFELNSMVQFYPNPTDGIIFLDATEPVRNIEAYNSIGQQVNIGKNGNQLDFSSQMNGIYLIRIEFENGTVSTQRITLTK